MTRLVDLIWKHNVLPYIEELLHGQHERIDQFDLHKLRSEVEGTAPEGDLEEPGSEDAGENDAAA